MLMAKCCTSADITTAAVKSMGQKFEEPSTYELFNRNMYSAQLLF